MMRWILLIYLLTGAAVWAGDDIFEDGKVLLDLRLRMESVELDGFDKDAFSTTVRTRLGFETGSWRGWTLLAEAEDVSALGDDSFNDTKNGNVDRPVVADFSDTGVNRFRLRYADDRREVRLGRQLLLMGKKRFIGNAGWRQNERTFDALSWRETFSPNVKLFAAYVNKSSRTFGSDHPNPLAEDIRQNTWLADLIFSGTPVGEVMLYGYFVDFEDFEEISNQTIGIQIKGSTALNDQVSLPHLASFGKQDAYAGGADDLDFEYLTLNYGVQWDAYKINLNYETLSGNGRNGWIAILGSRHGPNGWADVFLNTPAQGLEDINLSFHYTRNDWNFVAKFHTFDAESDSLGLDYGDELDLQLTRKFSARYNGGFKFADYNGDFGDRRKIWLWGGIKL